MNLAATGFKNQGQFVAAVRVSDNLGIAFADLKAKMVDEGLSLGRAIQELRPAASGVIEASRAQYQARIDLAEESTVTTGTTSTTTTKTRTKTQTKTTKKSNK